MAALVLDHDRIQNALVDLAKTSGLFFGVTYDPATGHSTVDTSKAVAPTSALANEVQCLYTDSIGPALVNRRGGYKYARQPWQWELTLMFPVEVTGEAFEESCMQKPPVLPPVAGHTRNVVAKLFRSVPKHPPTQEPQTGSRIDYIFDLRLSPT